MRCAWKSTALGLIAAAMTLGLGTDAIGQVAAGGNGRALDANQQAGGTGINAIDPNQNIDYAARNNLVTGNVAGGRGFRGDVPYSAAGEFGFDRSASSSNSLFSFSARSIPSAPGVQGATQVGTLSDQTIGVYSNFNTYGASRIDRPLAVRGQASGIGTVVRYVPNSTLNSELSTQTLGIQQGPNGTYTRVVASPLLGLRQTTVRPGNQNIGSVPSNDPSRTDPNDNDGGQLDGQGRVTTEILPQSRLNEGGFGSGRPGEATDEEVASGGVWRQANPLNSVDELDQRLGYFTGRFNPTTNPSDDSQVQAQAAPGLALGRSIRRQFDPSVSAAGITAARLAADTARLKEEEPADAQPDSPYLELLQAARNQARGVDMERFERGNVPSPLTEPSDSAMENAVANRQKAAARALGIDGEENDLTRSGSLIRGDEINEMLNLLDYDLPPLEKLAAENQDRLNQALQTAESAMARGAYVEAESAYSRAQNLSPNDPLIRMGLVHAQLGAGMFRSAAFNIRRVFAEHPELIAARYTAKLLPSQERLEQVSIDLQRLAAQPRSANDAGVLLGYLGYQTDSPTLVRFGLAVAEAGDPRQDLLPVLRRIWLDAETNEEADQTP